MPQLILIPASAAFVTLLLTPLVRWFAIRRGWVDRPDGIRKLHGVPIARVGGIAMVLGWAVSAFVAAHIRDTQVSQFAEAALRFLPAAGFVFAVGLYDDLFQIGPNTKLLMQLVAGLLAYAGGIRLDHFLTWHIPTSIALPATMLWLAAVSNAFNLIDGMDGLAPGVGAIAALGMFAAGYVLHDPVLACMGLMLFASLAAFLVHNAPPAAVFMGDCGSLPTGFLLGCCSVLWARHTTATSLLGPALVLFIPLADTALAIGRRSLRGRSPFSTDRGHVHHKLLDSGFCVPGALVAMYLVGLCAVLLAIALTVADWMTPAVLAAAVWSLVTMVKSMGYVEFAALGEVLSPAGLIGRVQARIAARDLENGLVKCEDPEEALLLLARTCTDLGIRADAGHHPLTEKASSYEPGRAVLSWQTREGHRWSFEWQPEQTSAASVAQLITIVERHFGAANRPARALPERRLAAAEGYRRENSQRAFSASLRTTAAKAATASVQTEPVAP